LHPSSVSQRSNPLPNGKELSRLITAAVVSQEFCHLLLTDPAVAMSTGYNGQSFQLAIEEEELVLSIRATSLADFAKQLTTDGHGNGHYHNYNGNGHSHNGHSGRLERKADGSTRD
jgi:hypothetical protein